MSNEFTDFEKIKKMIHQNYQFSSDNLQQNCPCTRITLTAGSPVFRLHAFFFGIPLLFLDLTLPPASPPRSRGLQRHLLSPSRGCAFHGKRPEVGLGHIRLEVSSTKRILETKTPRNPTRKSVPPRTRKRTKSGRVREGQNSRIRRPSKSVYFSIQTLLRI